MRLEPVYRLRFDYPQSWGVDLRGDHGVEEHLYLLAAGEASGRVAGRFRASNSPRRRTDGTFVSDFSGVIETDDGATILVTYQGYGRRRTPEYDRLSPGARQWVATAFHLSDHERYQWLNDVVCVGAGQVRPKPTPTPENPSDLVLDVAELVWEPLGER